MADHQFNLFAKRALPICALPLRLCDVRDRPAVILSDGDAVFQPRKVGHGNVTTRDRPARSVADVPVLLGGFRSRRETTAWHIP
jgi:hypothetical protein